MAYSKKVSSATDAVSSMKSNPYIQRAIKDEDLHDSVREAINAARSVMDQFQNNKSTAKTLKNDKLYNDLQSLAVSAIGAGEMMKAAPKKQKKGGAFRKLLLLVIAGGAALAASESLRSKVLDMLFGPEEEFQYTPPAASTNGAAATTPPAPTPAAAASETATKADTDKAEDKAAEKADADNK